ncbi:MAG: lysophospholipid acyltransferase family protein, partial [Phycisphaeraceae bacterium]
RVFGAKELVGEVGMVVISLMVWQMPRTDALMRPLMIGLAFVYVAVGIYGVKRYIMTGPTGTRVLNVVWRVIRLISEGMHQLDVRGRGNMPRTGPALLVANHTAGTDPMLIQSAVQRKVRWMMANEYMFPALNFIWCRMQPIGVARTGRDATAARQAIAALRNGYAVAVFPEGRINRDREPLQEFSAGVGLIALRSGAPVVPIWIEGTPRGKVLGAYLRFSRSRVRFGEPFVVDPNMKPVEAAELMRQKVADLGVWDAESDELTIENLSAHWRRST